MLALTLCLENFSLCGLSFIFGGDQITAEIGKTQLKYNDITEVLLWSVKNASEEVTAQLTHEFIATMLCPSDIEQIYDVFGVQCNQYFGNERYRES